MDYYDISDITAKEEYVTVKFSQKISFPIEVRANIQTKLPIYMLEFLIENEHCFLSKELIDLNLENDLEACSPIVNLRENFRNFYRVVDCLNPETDLSQYFVKRMREYSEYISKKEIDDEVYCLMDDEEKEIIINSRKIFHLFK